MFLVSNMDKTISNILHILYIYIGILCYEYYDKFKVFNFQFSITEIFKNLLSILIFILPNILKGDPLFIYQDIVQFPSNAEFFKRPYLDQKWDYEY